VSSNLIQVTTEYGKIHDKANQILAAKIVGSRPGEQGVQLRSEPRFSFFNVPGIEQVPTLLQKVSEACDSAGSEASGGALLGPGEQRQKARGLLTVFDGHFSESLALKTADAASADSMLPDVTGFGKFTRAEDDLLLSGTLPATPPFPPNSPLSFARASAGAVKDQL